MCCQCQSCSNWIFTKELPIKWNKHGKRIDLERFSVSIKGSEVRMVCTQYLLTNSMEPRWGRCFWIWILRDIDKQHPSSWKLMLANDEWLQTHGAILDMWTYSAGNITERPLYRYLGSPHRRRWTTSERTCRKTRFCVSWRGKRNWQSVWQTLLELFIDADLDGQLQGEINL